MNMLFALFGLIPGIQVVYRFGVELSERDFHGLPSDWSSSANAGRPK